MLRNYLLGCGGFECCGWAGCSSVRGRRGGLGAGWVTLPPSTLTVGVLRRFFESVLTRGFIGIVIKLLSTKLT